MSKTLTRTLALLGTLVALSTAALDASAATIRVKCETRTGRSSASIDGAALAAGTYSAVLTSGTHTARSLVANSVAGEVGFDFDSNPKDIRQDLHRRRPCHRQVAELAWHRGRPVDRSLPRELNQLGAGPHPARSQMRSGPSDRPALSLAAASGAQCLRGRSGPWLVCWSAPPSRRVRAGRCRRTG